MFVRQKRNRSGSISVQVIDKYNGYRVVKTLGSSKDPEQIDRLVELGKLFIARQSGQYALFPADQHSNAVALVKRQLSLCLSDNYSSSSPAQNR